MFAARRFAASGRRLAAQQPPRRFGSGSAHAEPVNEGVGRSFYVTVGACASAYILYRVSLSSQDSGSESWVSSLIHKYSPSQEEFEKRNAVHTALLEKAAADRHLLQSQGPSDTYELRQPDMFNVHVPYNVSPGSQADLSAVVAHYKRQNKETEESQAARMKDGKGIYE